MRANSQNHFPQAPKFRDDQGKGKRFQNREHSRSKNHNRSNNGYPRPRRQDNDRPLYNDRTSALMTVILMHF